MGLGKTHVSGEMELASLNVPGGRFPGHCIEIGARDWTRLFCFFKK
jgi:hypothetical protein